MEPSKHIKQHDFVSSKPKHKWFLHWTAEQNPCNEISLSDWGDSMLNGGFRQGELERYMRLLYPEVQRTYEISPQVERLQEMSEPKRMWSKIMLNSNY